MAKTFPHSRHPASVTGADRDAWGAGDSSGGGDLCGVKPTASRQGTDGCPRTENDVAFDEGKTTDLDFERPPPADEGDNPDEQEAAREQARRSIPPRSRVKPGPR